LEYLSPKGGNSTINHSEQTSGTVIRMPVSTVSKSNRWKTTHVGPPSLDFSFFPAV
jgi:hypothetical protein